MSDQQEEQLTESDDIDISNPVVRPRNHGGFERTPRFDGTPTPEQKLEYVKSLPPSVLKGKEGKALQEGKGFKSLIGIPSMKGWTMRVRHFINGKYVRCLAYQGYCPACVSEVLKKKDNGRAANPSDAYIGPLIVVTSDVKGNPIYGPDKEIIWKPAYTIAGATKIVRIREMLDKYGGDPAGLPIEVTLTNPQFKDWETQVWPERSEVFKNFSKQLAVPNGDLFTWKSEIIEKLDKEGLPKKLYPSFLCKEYSPADLIREFELEDQYDKLEELTKKERDTHASHSSEKAPAGPKAAPPPDGVSLEDEGAPPPEPPAPARPLESTLDDL